MTTSNELSSLGGDFEAAMTGLGLAHEIRWVLQDSRSQNKKWLSQVAERRKAGEPLAYVLGSWAFLDHEFYVEPGVLIPRPETEELAELALGLVKTIKKPIRVLDAGAGSGCLGLSLALARAALPEAFGDEFVLVERSARAVETLNRNLQKHSKNLQRVSVEIVNTDWCSVNIKNLDLLVGNPPYISWAEWTQVDSSVKAFEPLQALTTQTPSQDPDCRAPYEQLFALASRGLRDGGFIALELGAAQAEWIFQYAGSQRQWTNMKIQKDICQKPRFFVAQFVAG